VKNYVLLLIIVLASFAAGCSTTEPENVSERPWNTPMSWENGIPGGMLGPGGYR
jgi:hypothetical protein